MMNQPLGDTLKNRKTASLVLADGSAFEGFFFGATQESAGEVVFNTGMVGYPESFTDPSYKGQILVLTYPLVGNYGVPGDFNKELSHFYESTRVHLSGLVVSEYSENHFHWTATRGLSDLLLEQNVAGISGIDTRALVQKLRTVGTMPGKIVASHGVVQRDFTIPAQHVVSLVSTPERITYPGGKKRVAVIDCGCKNTIISSLLKRGLSVVRVPWNDDLKNLDVDGVLFSNGPGDPVTCEAVIQTARRVIEQGIPAFGICLGNQILALALGANTFKLKYGHRGQNQPCQTKNGVRCYITSQNHGYAVDVKTLPEGLNEWFVNLNDGTNEGLRHVKKPIMSVQFHPEAMPGPVDTGFLFDEFADLL